MNVDSNLKFPLIELSEWIFEKEKVFFEILESEIGAIHHVKESQIKKRFTTTWRNVLRHLKKRFLGSL